MTAVHHAPTLVERLAAEFDVLPPALVRRCVEAATPARPSEGASADVEGTARRDLVGLAEALQRRDPVAGR